MSLREPRHLTRLPISKSRVEYKTMSIVVKTNVVTCRRRCRRTGRSSSDDSSGVHETKGREDDLRDNGTWSESPYPDTMGDPFLVTDTPRQDLGNGEVGGKDVLSPFPPIYLHRRPVQYIVKTRSQSRMFYPHCYRWMR